MVGRGFRALLGFSFSSVSKLSHLPEPSEGGAVLGAPHPESLFAFGFLFDLC